MKRRTFLKNTGCGLTAGILLGKKLSGAKDKRPNIIFIMTDQQSATMLSCTGNKYLKTPAMDSLAASGTRFERAYAANPVCLPNRFSFITGHMPGKVGININEDGRKAKISEDIIENSMGSLFHKAGYEITYGGKIHLPHKLNPRKTEWNFLTRDERDLLANKCAEYIKDTHLKPFLLFASFINPHDICYMALNEYLESVGKKKKKNRAAKIAQMYLDKVLKDKDKREEFVQKNCPPLPDNFEVPELEPEGITQKYLNVRPFRAYARKNYTESDWRIHRWLYHLLTERVDKQIGKVLNAIKEAGIEDNTLVVFTSDHGDMDSAHRLEHKSILYEEAVRIPFIMSFKKRIPRGRVDKTHLISNGLDLLPTLCGFAGIEIPKQLPGISLRAVAEAKQTKPIRDYVPVESQNGRMIRTKKYKYCIYDSGKKREQLTDLEKDPGEMKNLAYDPKYKSILEEHRKLLKEWVEKVDDKIGAKYII